MLTKLIFAGMGGMFAISLVVQAMLAGVFIDDVLALLGSTERSIELVHRYILFVMLGIAGYRFFMHKGFLNNVLHYLNLPYSRQQLIGILVVSTMFNASQLALIVFFVAFSLSIVIPAQGFFAGVAYLVGCLLILAGINFLTLLLRELQKRSIIVFAQAVLIIAGIALVSNVSPVDFIRTASSYLFDNLLYGSRLVAGGILIVALSLMVAYAEVLRRYTYMDNLGSVRAGARKSRSLITPSGRVGSYVLLAWRLLVRNRYTKQQMFSLTLLTAIFSAQMMSFDPALIGRTWIIYGLILSGGFLLQYGPLMYAFEGQYFDGLLAQNFDLRAYLVARALFLLLISLIYFVLLTIAFLIFAPYWVTMMVAMTLYNIGVHIFLVLIAGIYVSKQTIDLERSVFMNYSTFTPAAMLVGLFVILVPVFIQLVAGSYKTTLIVLSSIGLLGIALHVPALNYVSRLFEEKKHRLAENLRTHI